MTTAAPPATRPVWLRPRYSLRVLFVAFTAFAIGFPIWYRWPYEETVVNTAETPTIRQGRVITTWQRQWGGGRLKHGPESTFENGKLILRATYRSGILDGPYETLSQDGSRELGQFIAGKKGGLWRSFNKDGDMWRSAEWRDDRLDGLCTIWSLRGKQQRLFVVDGRFVQPDGKNVSTITERRLLFSRGRLTEADGAKVEDRLVDLVADRRIDNRRIAGALKSLTRVEFAETRLKDAMDYLAAEQELPLVLDPHHAEHARLLTDELQGMELGWALQILLAPIDHACDYRYGALWVTSTADAEDWKDPTGVADIIPPKGSQLAKSWDEAAQVRAADMPLANVIEEQLVPRLAIDVDVSAIRPGDVTESEYRVTCRRVGVEFKHVLGSVLYHARCRCELRGETLVILPQDAKASP